MCNRESERERDKKMAEQKSAKVIIIFKSTPGAPALEKPKYGFFANHTVQKVLTTLRKLLNLTNETPLVN